MENLAKQDLAQNAKKELEQNAKKEWVSPDMQELNLKNGLTQNMPEVTSFNGYVS